MNTATKREKRPCRLCEKPVVYRDHVRGVESTRQTYPHKCSHGNWCRAGDKLHGRYHANHCCSPLKRGGQGR